MLRPRQSIFINGRLLVPHVAAKNVKLSSRGFSVGSANISRLVRSLRQGKGELTGWTDRSATLNLTSRAYRSKARPQNENSGNDYTGLCLTVFGSVLAARAALEYDADVVSEEAERNETQQSEPFYETTAVNVGLSYQSSLQQLLPKTSVVCEAAAVKGQVNADANPPELSKPRNVMLHRIRSIKARCLQDKYDVNWKEVLGEGGYGAVYPARLRSTGEKVALKKIAKRYTDKSDFQRETDALLRIHDNGGHPNIACLRDMYEDYSHFYLVLDLIRGGEMFDHLIDYGAYSEADAARLMREVASALAFLHGVGIVHADLKPENLMLCSTKREAGTIKLVDFGCARVTHDNFHDGWDDNDRVDASSLSNMAKKDNDTAGTTAYWPPEQFKPKHEPTPAMDMWSVGVILYIMLTGIHPFDPEGNNTDAQIEERIKKNPNPPIGEYTAHLSPSAIDLIKKLMDPKVNKRIDAYNMLNHPWVRGETANTWVMKGSDKKLAKFKELRSQVEASIFAALIHASSQEINLSELRRDPLNENVIKSEGNLMKKAFELFDSEGKGVVSFEDLGRSVSKYTGNTISEEEFKEMLEASAASRRQGEDERGPSTGSLALSDFTELFSKLKYVHVPRGEYFFQAGEPGDCMYFINSGKVEIVTRKGQVVSMLRAGEFFGEGSLLESDNRRFAGAKAVTPVDALKITREDFDRYTAAPSAHGITVPLKLKWKTRQLENAKNLIRLEKSVGVREYKKGDVIYAEGEPGDSIYHVNEENGGKLDVFHKDASTGKLVKTHEYEAGDSCGLSSILFKKPHTSTVVCATEKCSLHELRGSDFLDVIQSSPELAESLRDMSRKRMFKKAIKTLSIANKRGFTAKDLEAAFDEADKDRTGTLNLEELTLLFKNMDPDFPEKDVIAFLKYIDVDEDGRMSLDEFKLLFRSCAAVEESANAA